MNEMNNNSLYDELKNAPLLSNLQGKNPYRVPDNYFETLAVQVEKKIENKPFVVRHFSASRMVSRFAAAASVFLFMGTAGWLYFTKSGQLKEDIYLTPEQISNSVYFDDLDLTLLKEETAGSSDKTATDEIENYLLEHDLTFLFE